MIRVNVLLMIRPRFFGDQGQNVTVDQGQGVIGDQAPGPLVIKTKV